MRDLFIDALKRKYEAEIAAGKATAKVYFDKPVYLSKLFFSNILPSI